jgi:hypothetical protein
VETSSALNTHVLNMRLRIGLPLLIILAVNGHRSGLVNAKIYPSPSEMPIVKGSVIVHNGQILAIGPSATIKAIAKASS